ncbi:MlaD family protein [Nocardia crassostreae]|uniref:MlaD family protein n=1 Tax=Nocardia crassostreae TaxID=53428 RepID=UPI000A01AAFD|nr:MlaD family protein [Nocardia crassostreae]
MPEVTPESTWRKAVHEYFAAMAGRAAHVDRHEAAASRRQLRLGLLGVASAVVVLAAVGIVYALPIGKDTFTAELSEAQSIKAGDQVRVSGVTVGSVTSLELGEDRVRMTFTVDHDVFLGDQISMEIRMLTVVGGHYLALFPAGDKPLGDKTIPAERVRLPYSLIRTMQAAAAPVAQVDADVLRRNIAALQQSLSENPDALRRIGTAMETWVGTLNRQNSEISQALTVMDEYLTTINENKSLLGTFVRQVGLLETEGLNKKAEITAAMEIAGELLSRIAAIEPSYRTVLEPLAVKIQEAVPPMEELGRRLDAALNAMGDIRDRLQHAIGPDGPAVDHSATTLTGTDVCVPVPGRGC